MIGQLGALGIEIVYARLPGQPFASVAVIVKLNWPAVVGVPEMTPVVELSVSPGGARRPKPWKIYGAGAAHGRDRLAIGRPDGSGGRAAGLTVMNGHAGTTGMTME